MPHISRRAGFRLTVLAAAVAGAGMLATCSGGGTDPNGGGQDTGTLSGSVVADGQGVSGATVAVSGPASRSATTGSNGSFSMTGLPAGSYTATVTLPDGFSLAQGESASKNVSVTGGGTASVNWSATMAADLRIVRLSGVSFSPAAITIAPGTTVRWVVDDGSHTVTPDNPNQTGVWAGVSLSAGQTFEHTFTVAGQTYDYHCIPHRSAGMTGTVTVQ